MKDSTLTENFSIDSNQLNFNQCIKVGNTLMATSLLIISACIYLTFIQEDHFSLAIQIGAHIGTIIFAATAKLGYVIRCIGAHGLGHNAY